MCVQIYQSILIFEYICTYVCAYTYIYTYMCRSIHSSFADVYGCLVHVLGFFCWCVGLLYSFIDFSFELTRLFAAGIWIFVNAYLGIWCLETKSNVICIYICICSTYRIYIYIYIYIYTNIYT